MIATPVRVSIVVQYSVSSPFLKHSCPLAYLRLWLRWLWCMMVVMVVVVVVVVVAVAAVVVVVVAAVVAVSSSCSGQTHQEVSSQDNI